MQEAKIDETSRIQENCSSKRNDLNRNEPTISSKERSERSGPAMRAVTSRQGGAAADPLKLAVVAMELLDWDGYGGAKKVGRRVSQGARVHSVEAALRLLTDMNRESSESTTFCCPVGLRAIPEETTVAVI